MEPREGRVIIAGFGVDDRGQTRRGYLMSYDNMISWGFSSVGHYTERYRGNLLLVDGAAEAAASNLEFYYQFMFWWSMQYSLAPEE